MDKKEQVLQVLKTSEEPLRSGEISEKSGLDKKDVDKAMKILKEEGKIVSPKRCFWEAK